MVRKRLEAGHATHCDEYFFMKGLAKNMMPFAFFHESAIDLGQRKSETSVEPTEVLNILEEIRKLKFHDAENFWWHEWKVDVQSKFWNSDSFSRTIFGVLPHDIFLRVLSFLPTFQRPKKYSHDNHSKSVNTLVGDEIRKWYICREKIKDCEFFCSDYNIYVNGCAFPPEFCPPSSHREIVCSDTWCSVWSDVCCSIGWDDFVQLLLPCVKWYALELRHYTAACGVNSDTKRVDKIYLLQI